MAVAETKAEARDSNANQMVAKATIFLYIQNVFFVSFLILTDLWSIGGDENKNIEGTLLLIGFDSQNEERHETK